MESDYPVPANRSPYRWRMIIRIVLALVGGCVPMIAFILSHSASLLARTGVCDHDGRGLCAQQSDSLITSFIHVTNRSLERVLFLAKDHAV